MTRQTITSPIRAYASTLLLCIVISLSICSCGAQSKTSGGESAHSFWDGFNFADTALVHQPQITEQRFAYFTTLLPTLPDTTRHAEIDTLLSRCARGGRAIYSYFMELAEKYLDNPNSPYRHEESFIPFLEYTINSTSLPELLKERPRYLLEKALMNRQGTTANDFNYTTESGTNGTLHSHSNPYILLFFFNPGCHDCARVKDYIRQSQLLNQLETQHRLLILAVYPDDIMEEWDAHLGENPSEWITARMTSDSDRKTFWLPAIPNLYLLNHDKKVLLKDAPIEEIEVYLTTHTISLTPFSL